MIYGIRDTYTARSTPEYFPDVNSDGKMWQEDVYRIAAILAYKGGVKQLIDVGCGRGEKLMRYADNFEITGIDYGENIEYCQAHYPAGEWITADLEQPQVINEFHLPSVIVCSDVIEHLINPKVLIDSLKESLNTGVKYIVLSTPDRQRVYGYDQNGIPGNPCHVREWTMPELYSWFQAEGFNIAWAGWVRSNNVDPFKNTSVLILSPEPENLKAIPLDVERYEHVVTSRPDVSVLIPAYNASKTIEKAISSVFANKGVSIEVCVCNDASTDNTGAMLSDSNVKVVTHESNQGLASALNTAASIATGRYFIELDADDWLACCGLKELVKALDEHPEYGFAYGATQYHGLSEYRHRPQVYRENLFCYGFDSLYGFLYRREAWDAGCRYRSTVEIDGKTITIQDWDMALQLVYHMRYTPIVLQDTLVLNYTYEHGSLTDFTQEHNAEVVKAFKERWPMLQIARI